MDQKFVVQGGKITAMLLFFCALMFIPLGFGFALSYPDSIWPLGLVFLAASGVLIASGISNLRRSRRMQIQADEALKALTSQLSAAESRTSSSNVPVHGLAAPPPVLARWTYTPQEWKQFRIGERKTRSFNTTIEAGLILVLGGLFIYWTRESHLGWAFGVSGVMALIYWLGKYFLSQASIGSGKGGANEVVITQNAVVINGKYNAFRSEMYRLREVNIDESAEPMIMEIVYEWDTRKGPSHDEIRIPIPEGRLDEARKVSARI